MRFTLAIVALTATTVTCQLSGIVAKIPTCALTCLATSAAAAGCGVSDWACQCGEKRATLTASATPCVLAGCTTDQALGTLSVINELCEFVAKSAPVASTSKASPPAATTTATGTATGITSPAGTKVTTSAAAAGSSFASSIVPGPKPTTTPIQVPTGAGSRMRAGAGVIGGALLVAMAL